MLYSAVYRRLVFWKSTDVSEEYVARKNSAYFILIYCLAYSTTLKIEANYDYKTLVHFQWDKQRYIPGNVWNLRLSKSLQNVYEYDTSALQTTVRINAFMHCHGKVSNKNFVFGVLTSLGLTDLTWTYFTHFFPPFFNFFVFFFSFEGCILLHLITTIFKGANNRNFKNCNIFFHNMLQISVAFLLYVPLSAEVGTNFVDK
jgi:hypothetical protein